MTRLELRPGGTPRDEPARHRARIERDPGRATDPPPPPDGGALGLARRTRPRRDQKTPSWAGRSSRSAPANKNGRAHRRHRSVDLAKLLESPTEEMAQRGSTTRRELTAIARPLWLLVDKLVRRDLAGMFDGKDALGGSGIIPDRRRLGRLVGLFGQGAACAS